MYSDRQSIKRLFQNVICRAIEDALFCSTSNKAVFSLREKEEAIDWLCGKYREDLFGVCLMAEEDPYIIMETFNNIYKKGKIDEDTINNIKKIRKSFNE